MGYYSLSNATPAHNGGSNNNAPAAPADEPDWSGILNPPEQHGRKPAATPKPPQHEESEL